MPALTAEPPSIKRKSFLFTTSLHWLEGRSGFLRSEGKLGFRVTTPPEFRGEASTWSPEHLFVGAIETCLMLTFAGVAQKEGLTFGAYMSEADGVLEWNDGSYSFTVVTIRPAITVSNHLDVDLARKVLQRAHAGCLVANSLKTEVRIEASFNVMPR
jgi:organic hydroperoxide reductase OsmC/OhrA